MRWAQREQIRSELFLQSAIINPAGMRLLLVPRQAAAWLRWRRRQQWRGLPSVRTSLSTVTRPQSALPSTRFLYVLHVILDLQHDCNLFVAVVTAVHFITYSVFQWNCVYRVANNGTWRPKFTNVRLFCCRNPMTTTNILLEVNAIDVTAIYHCQLRTLTATNTFFLILVNEVSSLVTF